MNIGIGAIGKACKRFGDVLVPYGVGVLFARRFGEFGLPFDGVSRWPGLELILKIHLWTVSLSLLMFVPHLNSDTDAGNFYIGEMHGSCKLSPFSLLNFHGARPHGGTEAIATRIEPGEAEKSINLIQYPPREFVICV